VTTAADAHDQQLVLYYPLGVKSFPRRSAGDAPLRKPGMPTQIDRHKPDQSDRRRVHPHRKISAAGSRAASPALAQPNTTTGALRVRSSAIRRAIAASDEILDCDRARYGGFTPVTVSSQLPDNPSQQTQCTDKPRQRLSGRKSAGVDWQRPRESQWAGNMLLGHG
jgi:hypothetical protein